MGVDMGRTLENVSNLRARISEGASQVEAARALPESLIEALKQAGVFRMYVPKSHGGDELSPVEVIEVIEELARSDASVSWVSVIACNTPGFFAFLPPATYDEIYSQGPDVMHAGSLVPRGKAVPVDGGYLFTGQWPFASGCRHADFLGFAAIVQNSESAGEGRPPEMRFGIAPVGQLEILDTWHVSGLCGTGSHDFRARDLFVPVDWTGNFFSRPPLVRHPLDAAPPIARFGLELCAVALGNAQGALDDLAEIGRTKKPLGGFMKPLAKDVQFHLKVGRYDLELRAARTLLRDIARNDFERATIGQPLDQKGRLDRISMLGFITELSTKVATACYHASGTTGLYQHSALQRRLRDAHAISQHYVLSRDASANGALLLGELVMDSPMG